MNKVEKKITSKTFKLKGFPETRYVSLTIVAAHTARKSCVLNKKFFAFASMTHITVL